MLVPTCARGVLGTCPWCPCAGCPTLEAGACLGTAAHPHSHWGWKRPENEVLTQPRLLGAVLGPVCAAWPWLLAVSHPQTPDPRTPVLPWPSSPDP